MTIERSVSMLMCYTFFSLLDRFILMEHRLTQGPLNFKLVT